MQIIATLFRHLVPICYKNRHAKYHAINITILIDSNLRTDGPTQIVELLRFGITEPPRTGKQPGPHYPSFFEKIDSMDSEI